MAQSNSEHEAGHSPSPPPTTPTREEPQSMAVASAVEVHGVPPPRAPPFPDLGGRLPTVEEPPPGLKEPVEGEPVEGEPEAASQPMYELALVIVKGAESTLPGEPYPTSPDVEAYRARLQESPEEADRDREAYILQSSIPGLKAAAELQPIVALFEARMTVLRQQWSDEQRTEDLELVYKLLSVNPEEHSDEPVAWTREGVSPEARQAFLAAWDKGAPYPKDQPPEMLRAAVALLYLARDPAAAPSLLLDIKEVVYAKMRDLYAALATVYFKKTRVPRDAMRLTLVRSYLTALVLYEELQEDNGEPPFSYSWHDAITEIWKQWFLAATLTATMYPPLVFLGSAMGENIIMNVVPTVAVDDSLLDKMAVVGMAALKMRYGPIGDDNKLYLVSKGADVRFDVVWTKPVSTWAQHFGEPPAEGFSTDRAEHVYAMQGLLLQVAVVAAFGDDAPPPVQRYRRTVYAQAEAQKEWLDYKMVVRLMESKFDTLPAMVMGAGILLSFAPEFSLIDQGKLTTVLEKLQENILHEMKAAEGMSPLP